jgi:hypothetical protein
MVMNQNNAMLMVIGLTLALVAVLAIAPILNDEMAYARNSPRGGGAGGTGGSGSSSISVACNPPTTCSTQTLPGGGGSISCSDLSFLRCGGAIAAGTAGGNGAAGSSGPNGTGGSGGSGGDASATSTAGGLLTSTAAPGGVGGAGGAPGQGP